MLRRFLRSQALGSNRFVSLYRKFVRPSGREWATYLARHSRIYHVGKDCTILPSAKIVDQGLISIGDRACLGNCTLICHDGSVEMIEQGYGVKLDRVGAILLEDDVYIGESAMILASGSKIVIGKGSIVGAGAVVRQSVPAGSIVIGNPAKVVGKVEDILRFWEADLLGYPWADIIAKRKGAFDPALQGELTRLRQIHFFGAAKS
jgi:acetyltransferase-like isoleucine patch superfamily enzyme